MYLYISPALTPPFLSNCLRQGWNLIVSVSSKNTQHSVWHTVGAQQIIFELPFVDLISEAHKVICVQLCIMTQNLNMPLYCIVYFWQFSLKCYHIVPGRLSFQFSSLFLLGWLTSLYQKDMTEGIHKEFAQIYEWHTQKCLRIREEHARRKERSCISKVLIRCQHLCVRCLTYILSHLILQTISVQTQNILTHKAKLTCIQAHSFSRCQSSIHLY